MKRVAISLMLLLLFGCAQQFAYIDTPSGTSAANGPQTTITFANLTTQTPTTILYYDDGVTCKGKHTLAFFAEGFAGTEISVPVGQPFTFTVQHSNTRAYCQQSYMFTPGKSAYMIETETGDKECGVRIEESNDAMSDTGKWTVVTDVVKRQYKSPFFKSGEWCKPLSK